MSKPETLRNVRKARLTHLVANANVPDLELDAESCLRGWRITQLFYAALFWVKAYFVENEIADLPSHWQRLRTVEETGSIRHLADTFRRLQELSFEARYELSYPTIDDLKEATTCYTHLAEEIERLLPSPESSAEDLDTEDEI